MNCLKINNVDLSFCCCCFFSLSQFKVPPATSAIITNGEFGLFLYIAILILSAFKYKANEYFLLVSIDL